MRFRADQVIGTVVVIAEGVVLSRLTSGEKVGEAEATSELGVAIDG